MSVLKLNKGAFLGLASLRGRGAPQRLKAERARRRLQSVCFLLQSNPCCVSRRRGTSHMNARSVTNPMMMRVTYNRSTDLARRSARRTNSTTTLVRGSELTS